MSISKQKERARSRTMQITLKFRETDARSITYYLRRRYKSKANLERLTWLAIFIAVADEAKKELAELGKE